jgi:hypothetical protein
MNSQSEGSEIREHEKHRHTVEITVNKRVHKTHAGENSVDHLKKLGNVPEGEILSEVKHEKLTELKDNACVEIHGGETFVSHHREHHHHSVEIKINNVVRKTHPGENTVTHLRKLGEVPGDEVLAEFKGGQFVDLSDTAHVEIHGGEIFASHKPSGGSS